MKQTEFEATVRLQKGLLSVGKITSVKLVEWAGKKVVVVVKEKVD